MGEAPEGAPARPAPQTRVPVALLAITPPFDPGARRSALKLRWAHLDLNQELPVYETGTLTN